MMRSRWILICLVGSGLLGILPAAGQVSITAPASNPATIPVASAAAVDALYEELQADADLVSRHYALIKKVIRAVQPSVVHIEALKSGGPESRGRQVEEAGAGVVFEHRSGLYVLTNRHVVDSATPGNIHLQLADGRFFRPTRVWTDADSDVAVLRLPEVAVVPCRLGRSSDLVVGDFVVAIGSPFGLNHSASYGILSAKGRRDLQLGETGVRYQDFLQTDAAINPGNSGGPLIDLEGHVIGINTAIASNSGANEGIGFAIPIDMAMGIARDLIDKGQVARAFLGVSLDNAYSPEIALQLGLNTAYGARVASVTAGSPAEVAALRPGDVILRFGDAVVKNDSHLVQIVSVTPIGQRVPLQLYRDGQLMAAEVTVVDRSQFEAQR